MSASDRPQEVADIVDGLGDTPTPVAVYHAVQKYDNDYVAAAAYAEAKVGGGGGGSVPYVTGDGSPVGVVTPTAGKPIYIDTTNGGIYQATGATSADWLVIGNVPGNVGETYGFVIVGNVIGYLMAGDPDTPGGAVVLTDTYSQWNGHGQGLTWLGGGTEGGESLTVKTGSTGQFNGVLQDGVGTMTLADGGIIFPSSDPHVAGAWWDNSGTLTRSSG